MASDDTRRVVVIDPATDNVSAIIGKASVAPGVGELRERMYVVLRDGYRHGLRPAEHLDAVLRVILGEGDS